MKFVLFFTIFIFNLSQAIADCSRHFDPANSIVTTQGNCLPYNPNRESVDYLYSSFPLVTIESETKNYDVKVLPLAFAKWTDFSGSEVIESSPNLNSKSRNSLEFIQNANGYIVTRVKKYGAGLGAALVENATNSTSSGMTISRDWAGVGINFTKGTYSVYKLFANDKSAIKNISKRQKLPYTLERLSNWRVGDSVSFEVNGSVLVGVNFALTGIPAGATGVVTGAYQIFIQKTGFRKITVEVSRSKLKSGSLSTGAYFTNNSISKLKKIGNGFIYEVDLNEEDSLDAYQRLFWGDFSKLQKLANQTEDVNELKKRESSLKGLSVNLSASTPFFPLLYFNYNKGFFTEFSKVDELETGKQVTQNYAIYTSATDAEAFKKVRFASKSFYAGHATDGKISDQSASFKWSYESNYATRKKILRAVTRLKSKTGINDFFDIKIPYKKGDLNFAKVDMELKLSQEFILYLTEDGDRKAINRIKELSLKNLKSSCMYLKEACYSDGKRKLDSVLHRMKKQLRKMRIYKNQMKKYLKAFAKFGSLVYKDRNAFKAIFDLGQSCGYHLKYVISGESFYRYEKQKNTVASSSCK